MDKIIQDCRKTEYEHVLNEIARLSGSYFHLIGMYIILASAAFITSSKTEQKWVLLLVPLMSAILIQFLLANNYAHGSRIRYIQSIEKKLQKLDSENAPSYWSIHDPIYFKPPFAYQNFLIPFKALMIMVISLMIIVCLWATVNSCVIIKGLCDENLLSAYWSIASIVFYLGLVILLIGYLCFSAFWSTLYLRSLDLKTNNTSKKQIKPNRQSQG